MQINFCCFLLNEINIERNAITVKNQVEQFEFMQVLDKKISFYSNNQIIERRSPSTKRRYEENYITEERYSSGDVVQDDGDLRAYNGVVYREAPSRHSGGHYRVHGSERRSRSRSGRKERGSDDDVEVVYGKEYVVER